MSNLIIRLRVIATLVIVAFHSACPYGNWSWEGYQGDATMASQMVSIIFQRVLCNTMLPVFFMISGMLFYAKEEKYLNDRKATFWKKFDRLMIPYFIILGLCLWLELPSIGFASSQGHLWFVRDLFVIFLFSILLSKVPKWILMFLGGTFYVIFTLSGRCSIDLHEMVANFLHYYIFFIGGCYLNRSLVVLRGSHILKWGIVLAWFTTLLIGIRSVNPLLFCVMIVSLIPDSVVKSKFVHIIDRDSFAIYLIHHVLIFMLFQIPLLHGLYETSALLAVPTMFLVLTLLTLAIAEGLRSIGFKYFF
jgi:surface polysaccharide O-acyltransferase-like enzyme